jgi:hypothetical protein
MRAEDGGSGAVGDDANRQPAAIGGAKASRRQTALGSGDTVGVC